jgi:3-dehydroquinate synthetase
MVYESALAERVGAADRGTAEEIRRAVFAAGLPSARPSGMAASRIIDAARGDKKARAGRAEYALPARIGAMAGAAQGWSLPVDDADVLAVLESTP